MRATAITALRRAFAALVLFAAVLAALDAALLKVWHPYWGSAALPTVEAIHVDCTVAGACYSTRPGWAIPMAIVIGLVGTLVAAAFYRPRPIGLPASLRLRPRRHL